MKWKWCEMCRFDGRCENQDRNMECACYAREQTLRAEQYGNLIEKLSHDNLLLKVANTELRDKLDAVASTAKQGVSDDNCSFFDLLKKIERLV